MYANFCQFISSNFLEIHFIKLLKMYVREIVLKMTSKWHYILSADSGSLWQTLLNRFPLLRRKDTQQKKERKIFEQEERKMCKFA